MRAFQMLFDEVDGGRTARAAATSIEMLPTTCHVYFGSVVGARPDGREGVRCRCPRASRPCRGPTATGPTAVMQSAAKMDHLKTGGTLLNMKFTPALLADDDGIDEAGAPGAGYFKMDGHHMQFNVVRAETLREAQANPESHRDLIVRVAGYSDYFCDLSARAPGRDHHPNRARGLLIERKAAAARIGSRA